MGLIIKDTLSVFVCIFLKTKPRLPTNSENFKPLAISAKVYNACKDVNCSFVESAECENRWYWSPVSVHREQ